jgi:hypothetical protein
MKKAILVLIMAVCGIGFSTNAYAGKELVIKYDQRFDGTISVNGVQIGELISVGDKLEIDKSLHYEAGDRLKEDDLTKTFQKGEAVKEEYKKRSKAKKADMKSFSTFKDGDKIITTMDFYLVYELDKLLKPGNNEITIDLSPYHIEKSDDYGWTDSNTDAYGRINKLEAFVWDTAQKPAGLVEYKTFFVKPTPDSLAGSDFTKPETIKFTITQ